MTSIVARLKDKDLIPHTTRGRDFAYLVIFFSWGHENGIS